MDSEHEKTLSYNYFATAPPEEMVLNQSPPRQPYTQVPESSAKNPMSPQPPVMITIHNSVPVNTVVCPSCQKPIHVLHKQHRTGKTYCFSAFLCFFLCWPCVCLPCFFKWGYKTSKFCPQCKANLGSF
ncbi:uncharacterized protein LOC119560675 [Drosophila subpulchrella]|uniref:uncharacterized protein LOC119560675 n=1 Tax=Drosophila subpulchrella TaxID=1486046 RepID=UPI0018A138FA|nr:uncharacterized protein LOC119560675 [Drosophila subpulchrella]